MKALIGDLVDLSARFEGYSSVRHDGAFLISLRYFQIVRYCWPSWPPWSEVVA